MNTRRIAIIFAFLVALFAISALIIANIIFFRNISVSLKQLPDQPAIEQPAVNQPSMGYSIPEKVEYNADIVHKNRKILEVSEIEAERTRRLNRIEAFKQLKSAEQSLMSTETTNKETPSSPPPQEHIESPTDEELKNMENKGILSY